MAQVTIDGRTLPIPDDIARDDARLREALEPFYPEARNATIQRTEDDGTLHVTLVKRAGPKGGIAEALTALPDTLHPVLLLAWDLQAQHRTGEPDILVLLARHAEVERAVQAGQAAVALAEATLQALNDAPPAATSTIPHGW